MKSEVCHAGKVHISIIIQPGLERGSGSTGCLSCFEVLFYIKCFIFLPLWQQNCNRIKTSPALSHGLQQGDSWLLLSSAQVYDG